VELCYDITSGTSCQSLSSVRNVVALYAQTCTWTLY